MAEKQSGARDDDDNFKSLQELAKAHRPKIGAGETAPVELEKREMNEEQLRRIADVRKLIAESFSGQGAKRKKKSYSRLLDMRIHPSQIKGISVDLPQILISILDEFQNGFKQPQFSSLFIDYLSCFDLTDEGDGEAARNTRFVEGIAERLWAGASADQRELLETLKQNPTKQRSWLEDRNLQRKIRDMESINKAQAHAIATWLEAYDELYDTDWSGERRLIQDAVRYWKNKAAS